MYSNRRPYYGLKMSIGDFFREPVRYLKQSLEQESMMEKPYYEGEYPKMHLRLPQYKYQPRTIKTSFGDINPQRYTIFNFGEANCWWKIFQRSNYMDCIEGALNVTLEADYFFITEFDFIASIIEDTTSGVSLETLPPKEHEYGTDTQSYNIIFPEDADGSVTICGFASTNVLISDTFSSPKAGMPVSLIIQGGALTPVVRGGGKAQHVGSVYGKKGADCGCITIESNCDPCASVDAVSWDSEISATTIDREDEVTIAVKDGYGPYSWEVSGTGFSLGAAQTVARTNTLISDDTACGVANISVTDFCEGSTSGEVVCTEGVWSEEFTVSVPQPADWNGVDSCVTHCGAGGEYYGNWGTVDLAYEYIDDSHRIKYDAGQGGWCYSEGCSDLTVTNTFDDSSTITTEEIVLLIAPGMGSCPAGCLKDWGIAGERWVCS